MKSLHVGGEDSFVYKCFSLYITWATMSSFVPPVILPTAFIAFLLQYPTTSVAFALSLPALFLHPGPLTPVPSPRHSPESSNFSCLSFSFCVRHLISMARRVSKNAFLCVRSVRYLVYIPAKLMATYSVTLASTVVNRSSFDCQGGR